MKIKIENGILDYLNELMDRASSGKVKGYLNRVVYKQIIEAQQKRWMTEGASEGKQWIPLNPEYRQRKLKKFASYQGGGRKMLIATNRLVDSMTGKSNQDHFKLVTERRIEVGSLVEYARYVDEKRDITTFGDKTINEILKGLNDYLVGR